MIIRGMSGQPGSGVHHPGGGNGGIPPPPPPPNAANLLRQANAQQQALVQQRLQQGGGGGSHVVLTRPGHPPGIVSRSPMTQTVLVNQPGGGVVRVNPSHQPQRAPVLVNNIQASPSPAVRVNSVAPGSRNVVINQPGLRPGTPGSQITVPLQTLQTLQPGQGIPTGQAGHLLVKTDNGQYQILRVGQTSAVSSSTTNSVLPSHPVPPSSIASIRPPASVTRPPISTPVATSSVAPGQAPAVASASSTAPTTSTSSAGGSSGGMAGQMTPDTAKLKCKNFLATLLRLASEQPDAVARNVRNLIQGLIDGLVDPEVFTTKLQRELNSSPQPCLVPFLKKSLPYLQRSLRLRELTIDGVQPPRTAAGSIAPPTPAAVPRIPTPNMAPRLPTRPTINITQQRPSIIRTTTSIGNRLPVTLPTRPPPQISNKFNQVPVPKIATLTPQLSTLSHPPRPGVPPRPPSAVSALAANHAANHGAASQSSGIKEKKSSNSYSVAGDEDINDVAAMGGVNLAEESQRMQGATEMIGTQIRSCKDETFLQTGLLTSRIAKICRDRGLEEPGSDVMALVSHATQDRLKTLLEKLSVICEHRMDVVKLEGNYEVTQDVKGQLKFLGDLDKIERRRHEEQERELLLRAAKSRTKTEDPEKEKLKAKAKELQRLEEEQLRHEKANNTALLAIGGPRHKKFKLDETLSSTSMGGGAFGSRNAPLPMRPRVKRVHLRDLLFLMEQEKELKRSPLLWKSYCS